MKFDMFNRLVVLLSNFRFWFRRAKLTMTELNKFRKYHKFHLRIRRLINGKVFEKQRTVTSIIELKYSPLILINFFFFNRNDQPLIYYFHVLKCYFEVVRMVKRNGNYINGTYTQWTYIGRKAKYFSLCNKCSIR